jgi:hypothetical protein
MTSERFTQLTVSDAVIYRIKSYRAQLPELDRLKQEIKNRELLIEANPDPKEPMNKELRQEIKALQAKCRAITSIKSGLPVLMYQATYEKTLSKKGYEGYWRKQSAARLNGLFMLDVDHVDGVKQKLNDIMTRCDVSTVAELAEKFGIVLIHVTPSGRGLRIVAIADAERGNLADNQAWLSSQLGVEPDVACKDASRCSFCPGLEDIKFIDIEKLFTYDNPEFDEKYGPQYRGGNSQPISARTQSNTLFNDSRNDFPRIGNSDAPASAGEGAGVGGEAAAEAAGNGRINLKPQISNLKSYRGKEFVEIISKWFQLVCKGVPGAGDRHQSLYRLACDLRYITDFDPQLLARVLEECEVGRDIAAERGSDEIKRIAADACALQHYRTLPKRMQNVLAAVGIQLDEQAADAPSEGAAAIDYEAWWHRLEPLLGDSPGYREAVAQLPERHRLAGVLAAGAMMGTYLTRCWWEHFDGKDYRLSFLVYIVGSAASGKSFIVDLDRLIMSPMLAADRVGREWERQYKEEMKKRSASSKNAKAEAPDQQHPVIRYVPSTISNAMLYRRLTDAVDDKCFDSTGQPLHLHCYTMEPELATALRAQQGSWAGKNDLELKSFHNEYAGVDYANDQSVNGIIQVNWNQVVSGTQEAMSRKIKPSTVLDGLVTRLTLFPMPSNDYAMIERRKAIRDHEREEYLRSIGLKLEQVAGELKCSRLVDFCYHYEKKLTDDARLEQDVCLDYFRKRIPVIMMRYTLVRIVLRQMDAARKGEDLTVLDSDLEFARLIGDWCLMAQMRMFGQMVIEALARERSNFTPRKRSRKIREAYALLPEQLTSETLVTNGVAKDVMTASHTLGRWLADGLIEKINNKTYRKKFNEIPE